MKIIFHLLLAGTLASGAMAVGSSKAENSAEVSLTRLDCGRFTGDGDVSAFNDEHAFDYPGFKKQLVFSCYLVRHGDDLLVWDTGISPEAANEPEKGMALPKTLDEQLTELGIAAADVDYVGASHYHFDHVGQAADLPTATLLIGKGDYDALKAGKEGAEAASVALVRWISGGARTNAVSGDHDVFGDGSVVMLDTPGHTPGHHSLLVKLAETGPVLLTGDLAHFRENYDANGVPVFNTDRADSLASMARFKGVAKNTSATVIIQHEPGDIGKLPAFPASAR